MTRQEGGPLVFYRWRALICEGAAAECGSSRQVDGHLERRRQLLSARLKLALVVDREVLFTSATVEVDEVGLTVAERFLADAMQPVLTPAAFVLTAVVEQLYAIAMSLSLLVLAEVLVVV